jgi:ribosome-associated heat shock protein Hsp15
MSERVRIDKWLWHARFYRSRVQAQAAAESGLIRLNGARVQKPSAGVQPGDILTVPWGREILAIRIEALAKRRDGAPEAQKLYSVVSGSVLDPAAGPS